MKQQGTVSLFQYWDRLRKGRPAPRRAEVEPADIKEMLADTFILERDLRGDAVFRLAGTRLCAAFGRELKGFSFISLFGHADQALASEVAQGSLMKKTVSVANFEGTTRNGRSLEFELLLLPLDGGTESPRALGSIRPANKPFWLGADPVTTCRIDSVRVVDPNRERRFLEAEGLPHTPSLAPEDHVMAPLQSGERRRFRHLVVIEGGRSS